MSLNPHPSFPWVALGKADPCPTDLQPWSHPFSQRDTAPSQEPGTDQAAAAD